MIIRFPGYVDMALPKGIADLDDRADEGALPGKAVVKADRVEHIVPITG